MPRSCIVMLFEVLTKAVLFARLQTKLKGFEDYTVFETIPNSLILTKNRTWQDCRVTPRKILVVSLGSTFCVLDGIGF